MAILTEGQYEMDGYLFGVGTDVHVHSFDISAAGIVEQDVDSPVGNQRFFGRDRLIAPSWKFELNLVEETIEEALDSLETLVAKWRNEYKAGIPGNESVLRYMRGGRTRLVYGRPRNIPYSTSAQMLRQGVSTLAADFVMGDAYFYDDVPRSINVTFVPPDAGGLVSPLISPITTVAGGQRQGIISDVGGKANAPLVAKITGPITNPWISGDGWKIALDATLAYDQWVSIDTRKMTVLRNDGASLAGAMQRGSRLSNARLRPGADEIKFGGIDATGTATCTVTWRPTYNAL